MRKCKTRYTKFARMNFWREKVFLFLLKERNWEKFETVKKRFHCGRHLSKCPNLSLSFFLSLFLSIYLSIYLSIHPSIHLSIYLSISFSISFVQSHSLFTLFLVLIFSLLLSFAHYEMRTPMTRCSSPAEFRKAAPFIQRKIFYSNCNAIEPTVDSPLHQSLRTHSVPFICRPFSPSLLTWFSQRLVPSRNGLSHIFSRPRIWKKAY